MLIEFDVAMDFRCHLDSLGRTGCRSVVGVEVRLQSSWTDSSGSSFSRPTVNLVMCASHSPFTQLLAEIPLIAVVSDILKMELLPLDGASTFPLEV